MGETREPDAGAVLSGVRGYWSVLEVENAARELVDAASSLRALAWVDLTAASDHDRQIVQARSLRYELARGRMTTALGARGA